MRCVRAAFTVLASLSCAARVAADPIQVDIDAAINNFDNPVWLSLAAGTYSVTPVAIANGGRFDAWNPWGDATCEVPAGCPQTVPTTVLGWKNSYDVISALLADVEVDDAPIAPVAPEPTGEGSLHSYWFAPAPAPDINRVHVDDGLVFPTAADGVAVATAAQFTISAAGQVGFAIRDTYPLDNLGGISLVITPLPEPAAAPGLALGAAVLAWRKRRRGRTR